MGEKLAHLNQSPTGTFTCLLARQYMGLCPPKMIPERVRPNRVAVSAVAKATFKRTRA